MTTRARATGFTLLELLLALGIVALLLVIVSGGLRVGLIAWQRGEERTAKLDRARGLVVLLEHALAGAFPYRVTTETEQELRILFEGRPDRLTFATLSPPLPMGPTTAFSAVRLTVDEGGLALRQQVLPNRIVLDRLDPMLVDAHTTAVRFRYLGLEPESWQDAWDITKEETLPRAVEITLVTGVGARSAQQILTVPIQVTRP
ncbi:MAG TPA: type II secretion system protein GspJ [Methylomirabilota bacterium]|nr:type II secretion system protein GspJ [Methylomirabilota bacterium]